MNSCTKSAYDRVMTSKGLRQAREKMEAAGVDELAIQVFAHYYRQIEHGETGMIAESSIDPTVAEQIAADTGIEIVDDLYGDSLGEPGSGAETVHGMLLANAQRISEALR